MENKKRLIDADELYKVVTEKYHDINAGHYPFNIVAYDMAQLVKNAPTIDAVEVVRCRDCKHFTEGMAVGMCKRIPDKPIIPMPYNAFCAFGERKEKDA